MSQLLLVKSNLQNRNKALDAIIGNGTVEDMWRDGSFNYRCFDNECIDNVVQELEEIGIESEIV